MNTLKTISLAAGVLATAASFANAQTTILWQLTAGNNVFSSDCGADEIVTIGSTGGRNYTFDASTILSSASPVSMAYAIDTGATWFANNPSKTLLVNDEVAEKLLAGTGLDISSGTNVNNIYGGGQAQTTMTLTFSNLEASKTYAFTVIFSEFSNGTTSRLNLTKGSVAATAADVNATDGTGVMTEKDFANYNYMADLTSGGALQAISTSSPIMSTNTNHAMLVNMLVTADANGQVALQTTNKGLLWAVGLSTVPEPSMFGLLAGLGALALVGARRRRSR
ncbi:MAG: PEP-CTERM sorting domain-containing protein [Opitutales bacterium]|nr:PEP-CTERM sorting domain-containing protein [Opitutales bacterium]